MEPLGARPLECSTLLRGAPTCREVGQSDVNNTNTFPAPTCEITNRLHSSGSFKLVLNKLGYDQLSSGESDIIREHHHISARHKVPWMRADVEKADDLGRAPAGGEEMEQNVGNAVTEGYNSRKSDVCSLLYRDLMLAACYIT